MNATTKESALDALVEAFKQGLDSGFERIVTRRKVPADKVIREVAASVLQREEKDGKIREQARADIIEHYCYMNGKRFGHFYPPANECPAFLDRYSWTGGAEYLDDEEMSLYDAFRYSLRTTYGDWYREHRGNVFYGEERKLTKAQLRRLGRDVEHMMKNGGRKPFRNREIKVTTLLEDGRRLVETMGWDGTLVSEIVK